MQFYFKSLCSLSLDPNTVHLAFRYCFSIIHLFMIHHGSLQGFKFLPGFQHLELFLMFNVHWDHSPHLAAAFDFRVHWFMVLFNNLASPFVPFILHTYVLNRTQFIPLQIPSYYALPFIYFTSINLIISVHMHFLQYSLYSAYGIISYHISYISFHSLFHLGVNYVCIYTYLFPFPFLTMHIIVFLLCGLEISNLLHLQPYLRLLPHWSHYFFFLYLSLCLYSYKTFVQLGYSHQ